MKNHVCISQFCLKFCLSVLAILICSLNTSIVSAQFDPGSSSFSNRNTFTPEETLTAYIELRDVQGVRKTLDAGADPNGPEDFSERRKDCFGLFKPSPLHCAAYIGDIKITRMLIEAGADVNARAAECTSPLQAAISYDHPEIFDMILNTDNFNIDNDCSTMTYLYFAIETKNGRAIQALLDREASIDSLTDRDHAAMVNLIRSYETAFHPIAR